MNEVFMKIAIELAKQGEGKVNPNPLVGAVIVKNEKVIGEGYHESFGSNHAEINAFNDLTESCVGAEMYVTLEPCSHFGKNPPCVDRIIQEKISKVYIGMTDPNPLVAGKGIEKLKSNGIEVVVGVLEKEVKELNEVFINFIETSKPFVVMKYAMTLDGKIATKDYQSKWISGEESRKDVAKLRNKYMGIMVGINTVLKDNPRLTSRIEGGRNPFKIIVDSKLRIGIDSNILKNQPEKTIIFTTKNKDITKEKEITTMGARVFTTEDKNGKVNLKEMMRTLGDLNIDSILLEGGGELNFSALKENIINKVLVYIAPKIIGGKNSITPVSGLGVEFLKDSFNLKFKPVKYIGEDLYIEGNFRR